MPNGGTITYGIKTNTDLSDLNKLKKALQEVKQVITNYNMTEGISEENKRAIQTANELERAMQKAYDPNLNMVNVIKFNNEIKKTGMSVKDIYNNLSVAGETGRQAFLQLESQFMQFNSTVKYTNKFLNDIATSFGNTIRWTAMSSIVNNISGTIQKSYSYVKNLDNSLNSIRIVTGKSADEMSRFAKEANKAAQQLAISTQDYTEGSLIYYQQGLDDDTVKELTEITAKASNVTGQSMETISEQLTAVWNGYQVANRAAKEGMDVYQEYIDKMAAVGATTASNLEELSVAMSKVASAASSMGVGFDDLNAQIATIVSVTRQAPESVGTALKTIYARLGDLKVDGIDEFGTKLGEVSSQLQVMGINVVDSAGNMRDMSDVIAEVAGKWDTWTSAQKEAAAVAMAGKRQYNNLIALFDNWDMYTDALNTSIKAVGTLDKQQGIALDSMERRMQKMRATAEELYGNLFDENSIKGLITALTGVLKALSTVTGSIGGLNTIIPLLGGTAAKVFSGQISNAISGMVMNLQNAKDGIENEEKAFEKLKEDIKSLDLDPNSVADQTLKTMLKDYEQIYRYKDLLTEQDKKTYNDLLQQEVKLAELTNKYKDLIDVNIKSSAKEALKDGDREEYENYILLLDHMENATNLFEKGSVNSFENVLTELSKFKDNKFIDFTNILDGEGSMQELIERFVALGDNVDDSEMKISRDMDKIIEKIKNLIYAGRNVEEVEKEMNGLASSIDKTKDVFKHKVELSGIISDATKLVGSFSQLASVMNMIKNLGNIWNRDDLSGVEKTIQTIISLSSILSLTVTGINGVMTAIRSIQLLMIATNIADLGIELSKEKSIKRQLKDEQDKLKAKMAEMLLDKNGEELKGEAKTNRINSKEYQELLHQSQEIDKAFDKLTFNFDKIKNSIPKIIDKLKTKFVELGGAIHSVLASLMANPIIAAIAAVAAVVVAAILAIKAANAIYKAQQEKIIKIEEAKLEVTKKQIEANKKHADSISAITEEYKKYYDEVKNGTMTLDELRAKTYSLCMEYGEQDLALKSLSMDYEDLLDTMEDVEKKSKMDLAENYSQEKISYQKILEAQANKNAGILYSQNNGSYFLNSGLSTSDEKDFMNQMNSLLGEDAITLGQDLNGNPAYQFNFMDNYDEILEHWDEVQQIISQNLDKSEQAKFVSDKILDKETMEKAVESYKNQQSTLKEGIALDFDEKSINNIASYRKEVNRIAKEAVEKGLFTDNEEGWRQAEEYGKTVAAKYADSLINYIQGSALAEKLARMTGKDIDEVAKELEGKTRIELEYIELHANTAAAEKTIDDFLKNSESDLKLFTKAKGIVGVKAVLMKDDATSEDLEKTFKNLSDNGITIPGISEDSFNAMDIGTQKVALLSFYTDAISNSKEYNETLDNQKEITDELIERREKMAAALQDKTDITYMLNNGNTSGLADAFGVSEANVILPENIEKLYELMQAYKAAGNETKNFSEEDKKLFEQIRANVDDGTFDLIMENLSEEVEDTSALAFNTIDAEIAASQKLVEDLFAASKDYGTVIKTIKSYHKDWNESIDDLQSNFDILSNAQTEFNKTGRLSIDTLQSLLNVDDKYLANLQFEDGQLKLNAQSMNDYYNAQIDLMEAMILTNAQAQINEIIEGKEIETYATLGQITEGVSQAQLNLGKDIQTAAHMAESTIPLWQEYMRASFGYDFDTLSEDQQARIEQIEKATKIRMEAAESARHGLGASSKGKDDLKKIDDELNRYWELNHIIGDIGEVISDLEKKQKKLHGKELISSLQNENELLQEQLVAYKNLTREQEVEQRELQEKLGKSGLTFDSEGYVQNYDEILSQELSKLNNAIASGMDDASLEIYEKNYEEFKKNLERYDTLFYNEMRDTQNKIDDLMSQVLENNLKAWETEIDVKLDMDDAKRSWADFIKKINTDFKKVAKDIGTEISYELDRAMSYIGENGSIDTIRQAIAEVMGEIDKLEAGEQSTMFESISQAQEKLKELNDKLISSSSEAFDAVNAIWDAYLDGIDQAKDSFDQLMKKYELINDQLSYQKQLIELLYGPEAYDMYAQYYEAQAQGNLQQIDSLRQQAEMWKRMYDEAEEGDADKQKYYENWIAAQNDLNDLVVEHIRLLQDQYNNTIDKTLKNLESKLTNGSTFDEVRNEWEKLQKENDKYFDGVERLSEISSLANKVNQAMNNTSSLKTQKALSEFLEKDVKALREKTKLSKYDMEYANAKLDVLQKEAALEEARNNKNTMKLTRNTEGNWSYQYVADEDDIAQKQADLIASYNNLYELPKKAQKENMEAMMELNEWYSSEIERIAKDQTLTEEEKNAKLSKLRDEYFEQYAILAEENKQILEDLNVGSLGVLMTTIEQDSTALETLTKAQRDLLTTTQSLGIDGFMEMERAVEGNFQGIANACSLNMAQSLNTWNSAAQEMMNTFNADNGDSVKVHVNEAYASIQAANNEYSNAIQTLAETANQNFGPDGIVGSIDQTTEALLRLKYETNNLVTETVTALNNYKKNVDFITEAWNGTATSLGIATERLNEYLNLAGQKSNISISATTGLSIPDKTFANIGGKQQNTDAYQGEDNRLNGNEEGATDTTSTPEVTYSAYMTDGKNGIKTVASKETFATAKSDLISALTNNKKMLRGWVTNNSNAKQRSVKGPASNILDPTTYDYTLSTVDKMLAFKSGGYTGEWGNDGKAAILHEKELVLNANDTQNLLDAVEGIRELNGLNSSISDAIANGVAKMLLSLANNMPNPGSYKVGGDVSTTANSTFYVTANFPDANDVTTIKEAILSLPNIVSQVTGQGMI